MCGWMFCLSFFKKINVLLWFQTWCLGKKGPLFVSVFGAVQTVCSAILSASLLGHKLGRGSLAGIVLMFAGLYLVLMIAARSRR